MKKDLDFYSFSEKKSEVVFKSLVQIHMIMFALFVYLFYQIKYKNKVVAFLNGSHFFFENQIVSFLVLSNVAEILYSKEEQYNA